eukprot:scaffold570_cov234-Pinguiococcus_pyrenoidosus.AAC.3
MRPCACSCEDAKGMANERREVLNVMTPLAIVDNSGSSGRGRNRSAASNARSSSAAAGSKRSNLDRGNRSKLLRIGSPGGRQGYGASDPRQPVCKAKLIEASQSLDQRSSQQTSRPPDIAAAVERWPREQNCITNA